MDSQARGDEQDVNLATVKTETGEQLNELPGKQFHQRVEEFSMWKDENTFLEMEYKRRRDEKKKMKGTIKSDKRLILSNRLYIPIIILIITGMLVLLASSLEGLGGHSFIWQKKEVFQIVGGVLLGLGIVSLMAVSAYTYCREDKVRAKCGYPSLFMSSLKGETSTKNLEETVILQNTFVDRRRSSSTKLSRLNSIETKSSFSNLAHSFSSTSTAGSWVHKHRGQYRLYRQSSLRRENSDSALDKIFARNRLLRWQADASNSMADNSIITDLIEETNVDTILCDSKNNNERGESSQIESVISMASSGYCSNISTNVATHNTGQVLSRHLSEPTRTSSLYHANKRSRMLSDGIIPDENIFEEQISVVPDIPKIHIECV